MFRQRIIHIPAANKGPELRAALEEHSKASNAEGGRYSVSQQVYSPENAFINMVLYENLAALDAYNAKPMDDGRRGRIAKIGEFSERRWAELEEVLVNPQPTGDFNYVLRVIYSPLAGKGGDLRKTLEERIIGNSTSGVVGAGLGSSVVGESPTLVANVLFSSLAGLEEFRSANQADPKFQAFGAKVGSLTSKPPRLELIHVLTRAP